MLFKLLLAFISFCISVKIDPKTGLLEDANFDILFHQNKSSKLKKKKSFFSFPEAKKLLKHQSNEQSIPINEEEQIQLVNKKTKSTNRKLKKDLKNKQNLDNIELTPEIEMLLPNSLKILESLKPKTPRVLKQTPLKKEKQKMPKTDFSKNNVRSAFNQKTDKKPKTNRLKAFDKFSKDVLQKSILSNRKLLQARKTQITNERMLADLHFQEFLNVVTFRYRNLLMQTTLQAHASYHARREQIDRDLNRDIRSSIRRRSREIDRELNQRFRTFSARKFRDFQTDIERVQRFYNGEYADDVRYINSLTKINVPVPANLLVWTSKDSEYLEQNLKPTEMK